MIRFRPKNSPERLLNLKSFIVEHPRYRRAYKTFLDWSLYEQSTKAAKEFLDSLKIRQDARQNCHWMLAKLSEWENENEAASRYYKLAVRERDLSTDLINDFLRFNLIEESTI